MLKTLIIAGCTHRARCACRRVLGPLKLVRNSVHSAPGVGLLIAWSIARDLLPAGLAGLFLSPLIGGTLQRLYDAGQPPRQRSYDQYDY